MNMRYLKLFENFENSNNDDNLQTYIDTIKSDCQPFIKMFVDEIGLPYIQKFVTDLENQNDDMIYRKLLESKFIFRGYHSDDEEFKKKDYSSRTYRYPVDSQPEWTKTFDDYFESRHGIRLRETGTYTGKMGVSTGYGYAYLFFPIGNDIKYYWSNEVQDFFTFVASILEDEDFYDHFEIDEDSDINYTNIIGNIVDTYKSYDLRKAIGTMGEIIFTSRNYYLLKLPTHPNGRYDKEKLIKIIKEIFL